jgi:hypothetical protein
MARDPTYRAEVFYPGERQHRERHRLETSAEVIDLIPKLLAKHGECEKIAIYNGPMFLFAVDCKGNDVAR